MRLFGSWAGKTDSEVLDLQEPRRDPGEIQPRIFLGTQLGARNTEVTVLDYPSHACD